MGGGGGGGGLRLGGGGGGWCWKRQAKAVQKNLVFYCLVFLYSFHLFLSSSGCFVMHIPWFTAFRKILFFSFFFSFGLDTPGSCHVLANL